MSDTQPLRALAIDIDGTLIDSRKQIMPFTRSEVHRVVREYGVHLILVTARSPQSAGVIEDRLGLPASYATYGGSMVWAREPDGSLLPLTEAPLFEEDVAHILETARGFDVHLGVYTRDAWYVSALDYWGLREARGTAVWPELIGPELPGPLFKIMFRGEPDPLAKLAKALAERPGTTYAHHVRNVLEIVNSEAVKLTALTELAAHLQIGLDQMIAFGDSAADLGMLEHVGIGVLMGNASNDLVVSDRVERTLSNDEDGIGVSLRKHFPTAEPFQP
ncbi:MAG: HAD hydrolase family protein [Rhodoglobus sp.]|nr:HAD hydrolase family protein [Rhodoglobus sp.]